MNEINNLLENMQALPCTGILSAHIQKFAQ